ncbi:hypothetical protein ASC77_19535 [Nocardioides sp. Root1257]|nr:hypothetical protein ASC77_19535 [Nocardioides sp. Root1257]KRC46013.1 hypothetical protein ASE24_15685 [Nocardioides sp. Root224]
MQAKVGGSKKWQTVARKKTTRKGKVAFATAVPQRTGVSVTYRIIAPATKVNGKRLPAAQLLKRSFKIVTQSGTLKMPPTVKQNTNFAITAQFSPVRKGRMVDVQRREGGTWLTVASAAQGATGAATFNLSAITAGAFAYRATARAFKGAAAVASASQTLTITAQQVTESPDLTVVDLTAMTTIETYDSQTGDIILDRNAPPALANASAGDVLAFGVSTKTPRGALRKVIAVTTNPGGTKTITTGPAQITDAVTDLPDNMSEIQLTPVSTTARPVLDGVAANTRMRRSPAFGRAVIAAASSDEDDEGIDFSIPTTTVTVPLGDGGSIAVEIDGDVNVNPEADLKVDIDWFADLGSYRLGAGMDFDSSVRTKITATTKNAIGEALCTTDSDTGHVSDSEAGEDSGDTSEEAEPDCSGEFTIAEISRTFAGAIGPLPVAVTVEGAIVATMHAEGNVGIEFVTDTTGLAYVGVEGDKDHDHGLKPKFTFDAPDVSGDLTGITANGTAGMGIGAQASLYMYDVFGPTVAIGYGMEIALGYDGDDWTCAAKHGPELSLTLGFSSHLQDLMPVELPEASWKTDFGAESSVDACASDEDPPPPDPPQIANSYLWNAHLKTPYEKSLSLVGYRTGTWKIVRGALPAGLRLGTDGQITGTPTGALGDYTFTVKATDLWDQSVTGEFAIELKDELPPVDPDAPTTPGDPGSQDDPTLPRIEIAGGVSAGATPCAVKSNGTLWCWGSNAYGALGQGTSSFDSTLTPVRVGATHTWSKVSQQCAITTVRTLWCWGENYNGQRGGRPTIGEPIDSAGVTSPAQVGTDSNWAEVSSGGDHTCAIKADTSAWCWGRNDLGQLGNGTSGKWTNPTPTKVRGNHQWLSVQTGIDYTCGLDLNRSLWCWGQDDGLWFKSGEEGKVFTAPVKMSTDTDWRSLSVDYTHSCATKTNGTLWCWGYSYAGELGMAWDLDEGVDRSEPGRVDNGTNWATVSAAGWLTCATKTDHTVWCLGQADATDYRDGYYSIHDYGETPIRVGTAADYARVSASEAGGCAITTDATTVRCWSGKHPAAASIFE